MIRECLPMFKRFSVLPFATLAGFSVIGSHAMADEPMASQQSSGISIEQRLHDMDKNNDGMVSVYEVRSFIESRHGKAYQQDVLDSMVSSASGKSCSTPFAKSLY